MRSLLRPALFLLLPPMAQAQLLVPLAQERTVSGTAHTEDLPVEFNDSDLAQAPGFGSFVATASASIDNLEASAHGGGEQDTLIAGASFSGEGRAFSDALIDTSTNWIAEASCLSDATLDFRVESKVRYRLVGSIEGVDSGIAVVELKTATGMFIEQHASLFSQGLVSVDASGWLAPGDYRVSFRAFGDTVADQGGLDFSFAEFDMLFELLPVAVSYCSAAANSSGPGAALSMTGTTDISDNNFQLEANALPPNVSGLVYYGPNQIQAPFGDGFRCVGGPTHRVYPIVQANGSGVLSKAISFTSGRASAGSGQVLPDSTWNFQLWYRDPMGPGGSGFNTSDGLAVTFCP